MNLRSRLRFKQQYGISLVELLVALAVNVVALAALIKIFSANITNYNSVVNADTLYQQMETAMQLMTADIRRAGYWANASTMINSSTNTNPFQQSGTDISVNGSCILLTYDINKNGSLASISSTSDDERYGYRLQSQVLQARPPGAAFACNAGATAWDNVTNSSLIQVTALTFSLAAVTVPVGATSNYMSLRTVTISMTARLTSDNTVTATMTQTVRVRNDLFV